MRMSVAIILKQPKTICEVLFLIHIEAADIGYLFVRISEGRELEKLPNSITS